jgi:hypothetical protein
MFVCFDRAKFGSGNLKAKRVMPGLSTWVNMVDYTSAVLPVTLADKNIDVVDEGYKPLNDKDEKVFLACELEVKLEVKLVVADKYLYR